MCVWYESVCVCVQVGVSRREEMGWSTRVGSGLRPCASVMSTYQNDPLSLNALPEAGVVHMAVEGLGRKGQREAKDKGDVQLSTLTYA